MTFDDLAKWLIDYVAFYPEKYDQRSIWGGYYGLRPG